MINFKLRDYQEKAHQLIIEKFRQNLKLLKVMPTGAGKSKTVMSFAQKYHKHYIFIFVVKTRKLVKQLAEDAKLFGLPYGVYMAQHEEYDTSKEVQICSIDTINARGQLPHILSNKAIVLIVDEADQADSSTYQSMINRYLNRENGRTFLLGITATPYNGLDFFDDYIVPITALELKERGILVDYEYFVPKFAINYDDVVISKGEWSTKQVELKLNHPSITKQTFEFWQSNCEDRQTLVFCTSKAHAENFCKQVNEYYGREMACFVHEKVPEEERENIFQRFRNGQIRFLVNIRIITRGVDLPSIGCIIDLASTLNVNLHIQKLGRGSRQNPFYKNCLVLDVAKNCINLGHFYQVREIDLSKPIKYKKSTLEVSGMRICTNCFRASEPQRWVKSACPYCAYQGEEIKPKTLSKAAEAKLKMEYATPEQIEQMNMIKEFKKQLWMRNNLPQYKKKFKNNDGRYSKDIARKEAQFFMIKKYGIDRVLKIRKSIGLKDEMIAEYKRRFEYVPLNGMKL